MMVSDKFLKYSSYETFLALLTYFSLNFIISSVAYLKLLHFIKNFFKIFNIYIKIYKSFNKIIMKYKNKLFILHYLP